MTRSGQRRRAAIAGAITRDFGSFEQARVTDAAMKRFGLGLGVATATPDAWAMCALATAAEAARPR
jgi:hypothetical protein